MQLISKRLRIKDYEDPAASFIIERIEVPATIGHLVFEFNTFQQGYEIDSIMAYDSQYNLRIDIQNVCQGRRIILSIDEIESSSGTRSGILPSGEWILVFKLADPLPKCEWVIEYTIGAKELDQLSLKVL
ncbi:hypothetical protein [Facklamia sp. 7083-14-GEN3]|uniref:hypothetical protein n=1 Tax=Facklamia sp. 7083-14-GEN3 TaxID=2973478 RepID=UPI00215D4FA0|nr:hypothetical protein [Facklamia sp. 7083-14-GEN3]MCR8969762.1 hypothetical protein [Facklamia sp. 7083-14-GEN3]